MASHIDPRRGRRLTAERTGAQDGGAEPGQNLRRLREFASGAAVTTPRPSRFEQGEIGGINLALGAGKV
jgi:hypothetical protein